MVRRIACVGLALVLLAGCTAVQRKPTTPATLTPGAAGADLRRPMPARDGGAMLYPFCREVHTDTGASGRYLYGFVNQNGAIAVEPRYLHVGRLENWYSCSREDGEQDVLDMTGRVLTKVEADAAYESYDPYSSPYDSETDEWRVLYGDGLPIRVLDETGKLVKTLPITSNDVTLHSAAVLSAWDADNRVQVFDLTSDRSFTLPPGAHFESVLPGDLLLLSRYFRYDDEYAIYDLEGAEIQPFSYYRGQLPDGGYYEERYFFTVQGPYSGFVDRDGNWYFRESRYQGLSD